MPKIVTNCMDLFPNKNSIQSYIDHGTFYEFFTDRLITLPEFLLINFSQKPYDMANFSDKDFAVVLKKHNYHLRSLIVHFYFTDVSGHYICCARKDDGKWYKFDDDSVSAIDFKKEKRGTISGLIYEKEKLQIKGKDSQ